MYSNQELIADDELNSKTTLSQRRKGIMGLYLFVCVLVVVISSTYYIRLSRQLEEHAHQRVQMTFELIFDDIRSQTSLLEPKIERFAQISLTSSLYITQLIQNQATGKQAGGKLRKLLSIMNSIAHESQDFGTQIEAAEILVYDRHRQLLSVYRREKQGTHHRALSSDCI